jgi:predicted ATP-dependent Lon-type protease
MEKPDELRSDPEVQQIKAEISETQVELQQTVAEIQERLSPSHLKDQAATTVRDATIGKVQHMMQGNNNMIPYALIGIGAAWLVANRQSSSDRQWNGYSTDDRGWDTSGSGYYNPSGTGSQRSTTDEWKTAASERTSEMTARARVAASRARNRWESMLDENPLALGIAALAAGALIGGSLPQTEVENEYLGETRDQVLDSAREVAHDAVDKVVGTDKDQTT